MEVRVLSWAPSLTTTCRGCGELRNYLQQKAVPWLHDLADDSLKKKIEDRDTSAKNAVEFQLQQAQVAELVDALVSGTSG